MALFSSDSDSPEIGALNQAKLNIAERSRTSRLPWRGQFSPELVEYLIDATAPKSTRIFDPFCGSGTVLYEALLRGKSAVGAEVNPAAWHMAALSSFPSCEKDERAAILSELRRLARAHSGPGRLDPIDVLALSQASPLPFARLALSAAVILGMRNSDQLTSAAFSRGCSIVESILIETEEQSGNSFCLLCDARRTSLQDNSVDAVITSPPYINVFNYHQNYRLAVELLGWRPLEAARSEIGANRKFRTNRFLTVVQYCIDMQQSLRESARILQHGSPFVIVLGRTSNVLGTSFANGQILADLIACSGRLELVGRAERVFTNRFGERICEDILVARKCGMGEADEHETLQVGAKALENGLLTVPEKNRLALISAIEQKDTVTASPLLSLTVPPAYSAQEIKRKIA